jgi:hypothetical protein
VRWHYSIEETFPGFVSQILDAVSTYSLLTHACRISPSNFQQLVVLFQQFITLRILLPPFVASVNQDEFIIAATKVLELLNSVNDKRHIIKYTEFYNDLINERIELKEDFINWKNETGYG